MNDDGPKWYEEDEPMPLSPVSSCSSPVKSPNGLMRYAQNFADLIKESDKSNEKHYGASL